MSHLDSTECFIEMFGAAFDRAHRRTEGADMPSERVKDRVMKDIAEMRMRSETADPSARVSGHIPSPSFVREKRSSGMDMTIGAPLPVHSQSRSHWWTLLMTGVSVLVVLATLRMMLPQSSPGNDRDNLAMAPSLATPAANACTAEPLTADEVMDMVISPSLGYDRIDPLWGDTDMYVAGTSGVRGVIMERSPYIGSLSDLSSFIAADSSDELISKDAQAAAEQFWTCLLYGTSYQVWGLIAPEFVQAELLSFYPVFRTEADVMNTIMLMGPLPYSENGFRTFFAEQSMTSEPFILDPSADDGGVWILETEGTLQNRIAIVELGSESPENSLNTGPRRILMQRYGDQSWIVLGVDWEVTNP